VNVGVAGSVIALLVLPIALLVTALGAARGSDTALLVFGLLLDALTLDHKWLNR
jgi:hypothetical protein